MRSNEIVRAKNYIKKHERRKRWIAFALCLSLITGIITLYGLNKPATAMTAEEAKSVGLVLETADSEFEAGLIEQTQENKAENENKDVTEAEDNAASGSGVEDQKGEDNSSDEAGLGSDTDDSEEGKESSAVAGTSDEEEEEAADEASSEEASDEASKESSTEVKEDVVITVLYVDGEGEEIEESKELKISESFDIKEEARSFEGYIFDKAVIDETEVVKVTKKAKEETERTYYLADTAAGEELEITEDAELKLIYNRVNDVTEYSAYAEDIKVKAVLSNPEALPYGAKLSVNIVDKDSDGYNYAAYLDALNGADANALAEDSDEESKSLAVEHSADNTILLDIAFVLDGIEYEPCEGTVSVSIEFTGNQITEDLEIEEPEELTLVHLPVDAAIMSEVAATSEATEITAEDIIVEVLTPSEVELGDEKETVSFETESFSVYALSKNIEKTNGGYSWIGAGLSDNSAPAIINSLGNGIYFGVVADYFEAPKHFEGNIAVNTLGSVPTDTIFDYRNYIQSNEYASYDVEVVKKSNVPGTFKFGIFTDKNGNGDPIKTFEIQATEFVDGMYTGSIVLEEFTRTYGDLYVYEYDSKGHVATTEWSDGSYEVTYSSVFNTGSGATDALLSSYVGNGSSISDATLVNSLHGGSSIYYPTATGYVRATNINNQYIEREYFQGKIPIKADDLLSDAAELSKALPYATNSNTVEVLNVVATTGDFKTDLFNACKDKYGWTEANHVQWTDYGITLPDGKILVINLDLTKYANSSYSTCEFAINGKKSADYDFDALCGRIIINPVVDTGNGIFSPYAGTFEPTLAVGTILAPYANVVENEVNGSVIGKRVTVGNGEIHKVTLISYLKVKGLVIATNNADRPKGKIVKKWEGVTPAYKYIYAYVCARTLNYSTKAGDSKYKDLPEYSYLVELNAANNWTAEITFPKDYYDDVEDDAHKIIYRVVEIDDVYTDNEGNLKRYTREELEAILKNIEDPKRKSNTQGGILIYDEEEYEGIDEVKFKVTYDSNSPEKNGYNETQRILYYVDDQTKDYEVRITNTVKEENPYELEVLKYVDKQPAASSQKFGFTVKFWDDEKQQWRTLASDLTNGIIRDGDTETEDSDNPNKVTFTVHPSALGMEVGNKHDYYFMFTENTGNTEGYSTDPNKILVKIKHYKEKTEENEICYYLYTPKDEKYLTIETNPTGDDPHRIKQSEHPEEIAFYNYSSTSIEVIKKWGSDDSHKELDLTFDIDVVLKRKFENEDDSKYAEVDRKTIARLTSFTTFTDLPVYDRDTGKKYVYKVEEYYGDKQLVLNGDSVNGFKLTGYAVSPDGKVITLTNEPVLIIEKHWTKNGVEVSGKDAKDFYPVWVNLYQGYNGATTDTKINEEPIMLSSGNNWRQEIVAPRVYKNGTRRPQYVYYIVECDEEGNDYEESNIVTYSANGGRQYTNPRSAKVYGFNYNKSNPQVLTLSVTNERGVNVLPESGGMGTVPITALGILLIAMAASGMMFFKKKEKL